MGKVYEGIDKHIDAFIRRQRLFFVATAPLAADGPSTARRRASTRSASSVRAPVAYLDLTGSGVETIAHLRENGRIVLIFCAFDGPPKIVRLHGTGRVVEAHDAHSPRCARVPRASRRRAQLIVVEVERVSDSCGYGVPEYEYVGERTQLPAWTQKKGSDGLVRYRAEKNCASIDGLPGVTV